MSDHSDDFAPDPLWMPYLARAITGFGEAYNRYEVQGLEHLPIEGGALLVLYHGLVPLDFWYLGLKIYLTTGRQPVALVDRWLTQTPGLKWLTKAVGGVSGDRQRAEKLLRDGYLVGVSPGGVREAIAGKSQHYKIVWGQRQGFAKLALATGVPIIPGFTQNVESLYSSPYGDHPFFQRLYEKTKLPLVPIVGLGPLPFPAKLTTWLGPPLIPQDQETPEALVQRTKSAIESLIEKHQLT